MTTHTDHAALRRRRRQPPHRRQHPLERGPRPLTDIETLSLLREQEARSRASRMSKRDKSRYLHPHHHLALRWSRWSRYGCASPSIDDVDVFDHDNVCGDDVMIMIMTRSPVKGGGGHHNVNGPNLGTGPLSLSP
jgi:hypothetical protein